MNLENRGVNSDGFKAGYYLRVGAVCAAPLSTGCLIADGTTRGVATTTNLSTGATVTAPLNWNSSPLIPNFFSYYMSDSPANPALYGPWTLTFTNSQGGTSDTATTVVTLPTGAQQLPFISSITLSGTSATPTFSWAPPAGIAVNGYRVNIFDKTLIVPGHDTGQVASVDLLPSVNSYTVQPADFTVPGFSFNSTHTYSIEISLIQTKDGTSNLNNSNVQAFARAYADFNPSQAGGPAVNLPVILANGSYQFNITVVPGVTYYLDPAVATGYLYQTGAGDPNFRSVTLPVGIGDGLYDIWGFDASNALVLLAQDWLGGQAYDFGVAGLSEFEITGIEASAGLNPSDPTAFVTGLTFTAAGTFTGTQTPLTQNVPEPPTIALLGLALAVAGLSRPRISA